MAAFAHAKVAKSNEASERELGMAALSASLTEPKIGTTCGRELHSSMLQVILSCLTIGGYIQLPC